MLQIQYRYGGEIESSAMAMHLIRHIHILKRNAEVLCIFSWYQTFELKRMQILRINNLKYLGHCTNCHQQ